MRKCINNNEYFMYSELPVIEQSLYYQRIYKFLQHLVWEYPHFKRWYESLFLQDGSIKSTREIIVSGRNGMICGVAILKRTRDEQKICTLRVAPQYQRHGIGKNLMELSFEWLNNDKPLITLHKSRLHNFSSLFDYYGFKLEQETYNYYNIFSTELSYNGILPEKRTPLNEIEFLDVQHIYERFIKNGIMDFNCIVEACLSLWYGREQLRRYKMSM